MFQYIPVILNFIGGKIKRDMLFDVYYAFNGKTNFEVKEKYMLLHFPPQSSYI